MIRRFGQWCRRCAAHHRDELRFVKWTLLFSLTSSALAYFFGWERLPMGVLVTLAMGTTILAAIREWDRI